MIDVFFIIVSALAGFFIGWFAAFVAFYYNEVTAL